MYDELKEIVKNSRNIVFFGGAGVSTESGVPDFRSENGLYQTRQQYGYSPEEMLSHTFYLQHTETFYDYYKSNLIHTEAKPNKAHCALAKLEQNGKLKAVVTQNIDGLHQLAGSKAVFELHGSVLRNYCPKCGAFYSLNYIMDSAHCNGMIPVCSQCQEIIKPDVVLYEESLNEACINGAIDAISKADTLIIGGTSLVVYPAAGLIQYFRGKHLVLINKSRTEQDQRADLVIHESIGDVLGSCIEGLSCKV